MLLGIKIIVTAAWALCCFHSAITPVIHDLRSR